MMLKNYFEALNKYFFISYAVKVFIKYRDTLIIFETISFKRVIIATAFVHCSFFVF